MNRLDLPTKFAPAARSSPEDLRSHHETLADDALLRQMLECFPEPAMAINEHRQIVLANSKLLAALGMDADEVVGLRPGEALACVHAREEPGGCGTATCCRYCGAVLAMLRCLEDGEQAVEECRIVRGCEEELAALDLRVHASPIQTGEERTMIFAIRDITDEKRRRVLERMFFHDAMNAAGGLQGLVELLEDAEPDEARELHQEIRMLSEQLVEELQSQRDLSAAERGELQARPRVVDVRRLLPELVAAYAHHPASAGRSILVEKIETAPLVYVDDVLLRRVLGNLIKNAVEASGQGQRVTVRYRGEPAPRFEVHNPSCMDDAVQAQVFQRSFSTKAEAGRGIGTYSTKLLVERYLGGSVGFASTPEGGTSFVVELPADALASE